MSGIRSAGQGASPAPLEENDDDPALDACSTDETARMTATSPDGLTAAEASRRLYGNGPNVLPKGEAEGPWALLWRQINNPPIHASFGSPSLDGLELLKPTAAAAVVLPVVSLEKALQRRFGEAG